MCSSRTALALSVLLLATVQVAASPADTAAAYLAKHNAKFLQMLNAVSVDEKALASMKGILLAPSDSAVEALAAKMGMSVQQLLRNPLLVDQVAAYHFLPGIGVKPGLRLPSSPLVTKTAEVNYIVRYYKDPKTNRAWVQDEQGNNITLRQSPVVFGGLTIVPLNTALMSGGYFASFADALRLHPKLRTAYQLFRRAGGLGGNSNAATTDATMFVPVDSAFKSGKVEVSSISKQDAQHLLQFHATKGTKQLAQLQAGSMSTLLPGASVKVEVGSNGTVRLPWSTDKTAPQPLVTLVDATGRAANVTLPNIWAGPGVLHGISGVLQPSAKSSTAMEKAAAAPRRQPPARSSQAGRRRLLRLLQQEWQQLAAHHHSGMLDARVTRALLQSYDPTSHFNGEWGHDNPASALTAMNTVGAAYAAQANYENAYYSLPSSPGWSPMNNWSTWENNA